MESTITRIVEEIGRQNPLHVKKLRKNLKKADEEYFNRSERFLETYGKLLTSGGKSFDYGIDCYLRMIADMNHETVRFRETGEYSSKSFEEVNKRVYGDPAIMEYYMHGLLLSQFLWKYHYETLLFFISLIEKNKANVHSYLEIGGGHGLYISEAAAIIGSGASYDLVDISQSSLDLARQMTGTSRINFIHSDIFEFHPEEKYDFITMGEVLEHVEDPLSLLRQTASLLKDDGRLFITTPTNAPTIDHIYLFRNVNEIRELVSRSGLVAEEELCLCAEDLPLEQAEEYGISILYCACLKKNN